LRKAITFTRRLHWDEVIRAGNWAYRKLKRVAKYEYYAPSRYAYGAFDQPDIGLPANSVVDFDIKLLDVTN
jgi:FKBP-type peptidyl-prolyl cis-trans isomerase FkpA